MKARVVDKNVLMSISPSQIMAYLRGKGAKKINDIPSKAFVMELDKENFIVPCSTGFADYASRFSDILSQLEVMENRSQLLILTDLQNIGFDIIRVRNVSEDSEQGTLNLLRSVDFVSKTKDMIFAAACSAASHKICYPGKKPQNAESFMETVRFGQTAQGSFIIQVLSPVAPDLYTQQTLFDIPEELSYEKSVIPTLQSGLEELNKAALRASEDDKLDHFMEAAPYGVTTNLCDAVTGMYESLNPKYIEIDINYSPNRKKTPKSACISIDAGYIPIIKEASNLIFN